MQRVFQLLAALVIMGVALVDLAGVVSDARAAVMVERAPSAILLDGGETRSGRCATCPDGALVCQPNTCRIANADAPALPAPAASAALGLPPAPERLIGQHPTLDPPPPEH